MVLIRSALLGWLLILSTGSLAHAGELIFDGDNEGAVFQGPITDDDIDNVIAQLENDKPKFIMLNSYGGGVSGAIRFAEYINDNGISTWVPKDAVCASACALVFLAGIQRFCEGKIYLHQFLPDKKYRTEKISMDKAFVNIQNKIGEVVIMLNNFGTPQFVLETMLTHPGLYELSEADLAKLNTVNSYGGISE